MAEEKKTTAPKAAVKKTATTKTATTKVATKPAVKKVLPAVEPAPVQTVEPAKANVSVKKEGNAKVQLINAKQTVFSLSLAGLALAAVYLIAFIALSLVGWISEAVSIAVFDAILQVVSLVLFGIYGYLNYVMSKKSFNYANASKFCVGEIILALVIGIMLPLGYSSWFPILAIIPLVIISAFKLWATTAIKTK